jgi:hypothetical protein
MNEILRNKIRDIERSRFILYQEKEATDFILKFFELENKEATRCRVWAKDLEDGKQIIARYGKNQKLISLGKENIMKQLFDGYTTYFYEFIFSKEGISTAYTKNMKRKQIVGVSPVIDVHISTETGIAGTENIFDFVEDFDNTIEIIGSEMQKYGLEYNILFTGNGISIIGKPFYNEKTSDVYDYAERFVKLINDVNNTKDNKLEMNCDKKLWADYYMCPLTFNIKSERISIPLRNGKLDWKWIDNISNIKNLDADNAKKVIHEIIEKCEWERNKGGIKK